MAAQMAHVEIAFCAPFGARHMAQPRPHQHQGAIAVRKSAHDAGASPDFAHEPFEGIVGPQAAPVFTREGHVGESFLQAVVDHLRRLPQLHLAQTLHHGLRFLDRRPGILLGVDGLQQRGDLAHFRAGSCRAGPVARKPCTKTDPSTKNSAPVKYCDSVARNAEIVVDGYWPSIEQKPAGGCPCLGSIGNPRLKRTTVHRSVTPT